MGYSLTYKLLRQHLVSGELSAGREIGIRIDQTLTQDATGTMAYLQFEAMGILQVQTDVSVSYVDHNTIQMGFENADDHKYLQSVAQKFGVRFSRPGNGICHQVHLERFGRPGKTLLGSDSHTPTGGGIGMLAIGAGGLDVAVAMGGGAFFMIAPRVIKIELSGKLRKWVSAKDVILHVLSILSTKGNVNTVLEYAGAGVETLTVPDRATITNMGAETGVTTSIFPSDAMTRRFLSAQNRGGDWQELSADPDAVYDRVIQVNLSEVVPMVAMPHSPGNVVPVSQVAGTKVDQVEVGSCTNSSLRDLMVFAGILRGKTVHADVSAAVAPGSRQVLAMISQNGALSDLIASGLRIMESACGFCIGIGQSPSTNAVSVRTGNRNFEGRSGTPSAQVYLASPETAALAAAAGVLVDPLSEPADAYPDFTVPECFPVDDRMIMSGPPQPQAVIFRGPNIGEPPANEPLSENLSGEIAIKVGDKITTDHIMPAGSRMKFRSNIKKYAEFVFEGIDPQFFKKAAALRDRRQAVFILAGESYGQGSSREHAALCPMFLGVKAVLAKSFERIHAANLVNFGIMPLLFEHPDDYDRLTVADRLELPDIFSGLAAGVPLRLQCPAKKQQISLRYELSARQIEILKAGGLLNYTKRQLTKNQ